MTRAMPKGAKERWSRTETQLELQQPKIQKWSGAAMSKRGKAAGQSEKAKKPRGEIRNSNIEIRRRRAGRVLGTGCRLGIGRLASWRERGGMRTLGPRICGWRGFCEGHEPPASGARSE